MSKSIPICRMGWRDALGVLNDGGRLIRFADGHAEVIGQEKTETRWMGIYGTTKHRTGGCCEGYLTHRSVELLDSHSLPTVHNET